MRVHFERIVLIVEELSRWTAGMNDQCVKTGRRERSIGPLCQDLQMLLIELI